MMVSAQKPDSGIQPKNFDFFTGYYYLLIQVSESQTPKSQKIG
jgi:hypothetical protein